MSIRTTQISRRTLLGGLGAVAATATLSACGGNGGGNGSGNGEGGGGAGSTIFVIGTGVAASNQFPNNFNRYGGGDTAPGIDLV